MEHYTGFGILIGIMGFSNMIMAILFGLEIRKNRHLQAELEQAQKLWDQIGQADQSETDVDRGKYRC